MGTMSTSVFLSSTAKDLANYREAAYRAIEGLDGYECVRMEDFGARAWNALDFCRAKVGECDLFIGIVGHLHGSSPIGSEKSYTELEYEAAINYEKPYLMFLASEKIEVPIQLIDQELETNPSKRVKQKAFQKRVAEGRICGIFNSPEELSSLIRQAIHNWDQRPRKVEDLQPDTGSLVPYTCDRADQEADFRKCFSYGLSTHPGFPQFYLIHGEERESHASLIERFRATRIQEHANNKWGEQKATVSVWDLDWPDLVSFESRQDRLIWGLHEKGDPLSSMKENYDYSAKAFASILSSSLNSIVIIQHEISAKTWDQTTTKLIQWYVRFWREVKSAASIPQCLVFLNVIYPHTGNGNFLQFGANLKRFFEKRRILQIQEQMRHICSEPQGSPTQAAETSCPVVMLKELTCVKAQDVMRWFRRHKIGRDDGEREQHCKEIFSEGGKVADCKNMRDVEHALNKLHNVIRRSTET
jgi:hypothetical protein